MQIHMPHTPPLSSLRRIIFPDHRDLGDKLLVVCSLIPYFIQIYIMPLFVVLLFIGIICLCSLSLLFFKKQEDSVEFGCFWFTCKGSQSSWGRRPGHLFPTPPGKGNFDLQSKCFSEIYFSLPKWVNYLAVPNTDVVIRFSLSGLSWLSSKCKRELYYQSCFLSAISWNNN